jgi:HD-GYP domain-containing protein (c-di-GMP phosphodiesterase class II)
MDAITSHPESVVSLEPIEQLKNQLKTKDASTDAHSFRVATMVAEWVSYMKSRYEWVDLDEQDLVLAARLHDIGKLIVRTQVLNKAAPLTEQERAHINEHAQWGYELLLLEKVAESLALAIRHHHERWDGTGYPSGLKQNEIPFFAQVISIVDTYDAITSDRPYRKAQSEKHAIQEIESNAGRQFSGSLVASFVKFLNARNT